jgi:hypothetical protein
MLIVEEATETRGRWNKGLLSTFNRRESARLVDQASSAAHVCLSADGPCIPAGPDIHLLP